jgi:hypothetical protein
VKILFDHCTPAPLRRHLPRHAITLAKELGWERLVNGRLLDAAEADGFDLLLSADKRIRYQQNLTGRRIALLVLTNPLWPKVRPHADAIALKVEGMAPGTYAEFEIL